TENDPSAEKKALEAMVRAGRKVGVRRLSDFSRTAVYLGRKAEAAGQPRQAESAYEAALELDESNPDAIFARLSFLARQKRWGEAFEVVPESVSALLSTHESRVAVFSSAGVWVGAALAAMLAGVALSLALRHGPRAIHDLREKAGSSFGPGAAVPLGL